jgi:hypothetical protein
MTTLSCSVTDLAEEKRQSGPPLATSADHFYARSKKSSDVAVEWLLTTPTYKRSIGFVF